jgi:hypothetical protein
MNLDQETVETIVEFLKCLPEPYQAFDPKERKQFLQWFVSKVWIKGREIVQVDYTQGFEAVCSLDLVRIKRTWLTGEDTNPTSSARAPMAFGAAVKIG